ncbi:MAG: Lrp/AsnC family transcriptional regulator [Candidatus Micrarchaeota archaeon]
MKKMALDEVLEFAEALNFSGPAHSRTLNEIAARLKIGKPAARRFLSCLGEEGPARLRVALNYSRLPLMTAVVMLKARRPSYCGELTSTLAKTKFVDRVFELNYGNVTHLALMRFPAAEFTEHGSTPRLVEQFAGRIKWANTLFAAKSLFDDGLKTAGENARKADLDERDWLTLNALYRNANRTLEQLAADVGVKKPSLHRRMELLRESSVVRGYVCEKQLNNLPPANQPFSFAFAVKVDAEEESPLVESLAKRYSKNISFLYRTYGEYDLLALLRFSGLAEYRRFMASEFADFKSAEARSFLVAAEVGREWIYDHAMQARLKKSA